MGCDHGIQTGIVGSMQESNYVSLTVCNKRLADNLPAATVFRNLKTEALQYEDGFKVGFVHDGRIILNNHLTIIIKYHPVIRSVH